MGRNKLRGPGPGMTAKPPVPPVENWLGF